MRHSWISPPPERSGGGVFLLVCDLNVFSLCVAPALTYALSSTPLHHTTNTTNTSISHDTSHITVTGAYWKGFKKGTIYPKHYRQWRTDYAATSSRGTGYRWGGWPLVLPYDGEGLETAVSCSILYHYITISLSPMSLLAFHVYCTEFAEWKNLF